MISQAPEQNLEVPEPSDEELHERIFNNTLKACIDGELDVPVSRVVGEEVLRKLPYISEQQDTSAADVITVATCAADIVAMNAELRKLALARRTRIYVNALDWVATRSDERMFDGDGRRRELIVQAHKMFFQHKYNPTQRKLR